MAHAQKPDFVFRRNGRVHLNRQGREFSRLLAAVVCATAVVMLDTTKFRGSAKSTGYPLHSPVSPSLPLPTSPCAITFQLDSTIIHSAGNKQGTVCTVTTRLSRANNMAVIPEGSQDLKILKCSAVWRRVDWWSVCLQTTLQIWRKSPCRNFKEF